MATLVGNQIIMVTTLAGNPFPVLQEQPLRASDAVYRALEQTGFVKNLTPSVALADVTVTIAESPDATEPVYTLGVPLAEDAGKPGQTREDRLTATSVFQVPDVYYTENPAAAPIRLVTVTLSRPFTFREQTVTTLVNVMVGAAVAALGASIIAAVLLAQWLTSPVRRLTHASRALAEGRLDVRVPVKSFGSPELAELAGSFNDMAERLQESIDIISADRDRSREFVADVSHELRTPIAALRTFNELLREGAGDDPDHARRVPGAVPAPDRTPRLAGHQPARDVQARFGPRLPRPAPGRPAGGRRERGPAGGAGGRPQGHRPRDAPARRGRSGSPTTRHASARCSPTSSATPSSSRPAAGGWTWSCARHRTARGSS